MFIAVLLLLLWFDIIASTHQHPTSHPTNVSHQNPHSKTPKPPPQKNKNTKNTTQLHLAHPPTVDPPTHQRPTFHPTTVSHQNHHSRTPKPPPQKNKKHNRDLPITESTHRNPPPPICPSPFEPTHNRTHPSNHWKKKKKTTVTEIGIELRRWHSEAERKREKQWQWEEKRVKEEKMRGW